MDNFMKDLEQWKAKRESHTDIKASESEEEDEPLEDDDAVLEEMVKREEKMLQQLEQIEKNQSGKNKLINKKDKERASALEKHEEARIN